jgi:hypothetical protein
MDAISALAALAQESRLAGVFAACWFVSVAMAPNLPRLLEAFGATPAAPVGAASLIGPALARVSLNSACCAMYRRSYQLAWLPHCTR